MGQELPSQKPEDLKMQKNILDQANLIRGGARLEGGRLVLTPEQEQLEKRAEYEKTPRGQAEVEATSVVRNTHTILGQRVGNFARVIGKNEKFNPNESLEQWRDAELRELLLLAGEPYPETEVEEKLLFERLGVEIELLIEHKPSGIHERATQNILNKGIKEKILENHK